CVLFESLVGHPPFRAETSLKLLAKHCNEEAPRVQDLVETVDIELSNLVERCLQKSPEDRFQSFEELMEMLELSSVSDEIAVVNQDEKPKQLNGTNASVPSKARLVLLTVTALVCLISVFNWMANKSLEKSDHLIQEKQRKGPPMAVIERVIDPPSRKAEVIYFKDSSTVKLQGDFANESLSPMLKLPEITNLDASQAQNLSVDEFGRVISKLELRSVNLSRTGANDKFAHILASMPTLERVILKNTKVSANGVAEIANLPELKKLIIDRCDVTDAGITALSRTKTLIHLSMNGVKGPTENGLRALKTLSLQDFQYNDNKLTDNEIRAISKINAKHFSLRNCGISDRSIKLFQSPVAESVDLADNLIGFEGLHSLIKLRSIMTITLSPDPNTTASKVDKMKSYLNPNVKVIIEGDLPLL
ncbi:MAG: hypothetical protein K2Z81_06855, partial [Cyanobacteria bacterium]|nr:hypothetical protein [Cyanobacteriota bacterium]